MTKIQAMKQSGMTFLHKSTTITMKSDEENNNYNHYYSQVFANNQSDDEIDPLTVAHIADAQRSDSKGNKFFKQKDPKGRIRLVIINKTKTEI